MEGFLGVLMICYTVSLCFYVALQVRSGKTELFSVRNFFLLGFIVFQMTSFTVSMFTGYYDTLRAGDLAMAGLEYTFLLSLFLPIFLLVYDRGWVADKIASWYRPKYGAPNVTTLLALAVAFLIAALIMRLGIGNIPVVGVLAFVLYIGLASAAASLAAWAWAPRVHNVLVGLIAGTVILGSLVLSVYQAFGRRDLLSVLIATLWGAFHGHWGRIGLRRASVQLVPLGAGAVVLLAAFTAGRQEGANKLDLAQSVGRIFDSGGEGGISQGILAMASGQAAAACSLWIIDTRPETFEYDTLHSLRYLIGHPIPRILWEDKPIALGLEMSYQGRVRGKSIGFNFGPGLIGHIKNDNPWLALLPYSFGLAILFRLMDKLIRQNPGNPIVVVPLGVTLGDVLALARGEAGLFLSRTIISTTGAIITMKICASVVGMLGLAPPLSGTPQPGDWDEGEGHDHGPEALDEQVWDADIAAAYTQDDAGEYDSRAS